MTQRANTDVTLAPETVHSPHDPRHFMRIKPVERHVRIRRGDAILAETDAAVRVLEVGYDFYDPVLYVPEVDVTSRLASSTSASTHCPIKGEAVYFDLLGDDGTRAVEAIAWAYPEPVAGAEALAGRMAFDAAHVTIELSPG